MSHKKRKIPKIWIDIATGVIVTVFGGLLLLFVQQALSTKPPAPAPVDDSPTSAEIEKLRTITIDSPIEFVKQQLGAPQKVFDDPPYTDLSYNFSDVAFKVSTKDGTTISTLNYLLKNPKKRIVIIPETSNPHLILGAATFGDYATRPTCQKLTKDTFGSKTRLYCDMNFAKVGDYLVYRVGTHDDTGFLRNLSTDSALAATLTNTGIIAKQPINFVSVAAHADDLDMFYQGDY